MGVTVGSGRRQAAEDIHHLGFERGPGGVATPVHPGRRARGTTCDGRPGRSFIGGQRSQLRAQRSDARHPSGSVLWIQKRRCDQEVLREERPRARTVRGRQHEVAMSATDALVELVRAALRDPAVRADILELVSSAAPVNDTATEPLLDAVEAAKNPRHDSTARYVPRRTGRHSLVFALAVFSVSGEASFWPRPVASPSWSPASGA